MSKIIVIGNQKGGVGKTTTTVNLGIGLASEGKRVLLIDADAQGNLTMCLGNKYPDSMEKTLATEISKCLEGRPFSLKEAILSNPEGVDYVPCNIDLSGLEPKMFSTLRREYVLKKIISDVENEYDYILIDCSPSLGMVTVNALSVADSVLIPVQAE